MEQPIIAHKGGKVSGLSAKAGDTVTSVRCWRPSSRTFQHPRERSILYKSPGRG